MVVTPVGPLHTSALARCIESVRRQSMRTEHIVVCDGFWPDGSVDLRGLQVLRTGARADDFGDTPRALGAALALTEGAAVLAFLDADNWYHRDHVASLVRTWDNSSPAVLASRRMLCEPSGRPIGRCEVSGYDHQFADTSCLALAGDAVSLGTAWGEVPAYAHPIGDRYFWAAICRRVPNLHLSGRVTVGYATSHPADYERCGCMPPAVAKPHAGIRAAIEATYFLQGQNHAITWKACAWETLDSTVRQDWNTGQHDPDCIGR